MATKIDDERIAAALITCGSVPKAADALGVSTKTIYDRQREPAFRELYQAALNDLLRGTVVALTGQVGHALSVVTEIMGDESVNPATRLQACQTILNSVVKLGSALGTGEQKQREIGPKPGTLDLDAL